VLFRSNVPTLKEFAKTLQEFETKKTKKDE
jgi:hypothetical protein